MKTLRTILETEDSIAKFKKWREHTTSFTSENRPFKGKDGRDYNLSVTKANPGSMYYKVHHKKEEVGSFYLRSRDLESLAVHNASVDEAHQRNGIASHVYNTIESDTKHIGMPLVPQGEYETSDDAKAFWRNRTKS